MSYKTILTVLSDPDEVAGVLDAAIPFAQAAGAHLDVLCLGIDRTQTGYYFAGATALMYDATLQQAQSEAAALEAAARARLARDDLSWGLDAAVSQSASVAGLVAHRARYADLVIVAKPYGEGRYADAPVLVEAAMFQGKAPIIVLATGKPLTPRPERVVVAWNESNEAMASIRRALPMLQSARAVDVCIVAPERHGSDTADPGVELSRMLSRHGVKVDVTILAQTLPRVSEVIARHVSDTAADMLVMGAYGHSRFRQAILGGATRNMLEHAQVPVFMAH